MSLLPRSVVLPKLIFCFLVRDWPPTGRCDHSNLVRTGNLYLFAFTEKTASKAGDSGSLLVIGYWWSCILFSS